MRSQNINPSQRPPSTQISAINVPPPTSFKILQAEAEGFFNLLPFSATSLPTEDPLLANLSLQEVWEQLTETIKEPLPLHAISTSTLPSFDPVQLVVQFFITRGTALINTGAASSFVNKDFIHQHQLLKQTHPSPVKIQAFDGSSRQPVLHSWVGNFTLRSNNGNFATSAVRANITKLEKVGFIVGMPWVGGQNAAMQFQGLLFSGIKLVLTGSVGIHTSRYSFFSVNKDHTDMSNTQVALKIDDIPCFPHKFQSVFSSFSQSFLPPLRTGFDYTIKLKPNCIPPFGGLYQLSNEEKIKLKAYIDDLLKKGFIQVLSSPAAAPIFLVKSKGKADHPCVDYHALNSMTTRDSYPLPHLNMMLENLKDVRFFSKIDLKAAFNLI
ncbi:hypothetical protein O181_010751 [Austropuccinia psidii MF-1]|uniref:Reverse transcriptase domain-containing protein n=1 Tax=Austropuccinia psidii MF-1 TaxID=1389203 RepID=A0A9Q3BUF2_9BASI|nr:hypothetical protein [Austropuccinia psidii MF-1]